MFFEMTAMMRQDLCIQYVCMCMCVPSKTSYINKFILKSFINGSKREKTFKKIH